ncbi:hypothetical protein ACFLRT_01955 [Acidobacteriota bacterium]
MDLNENLSIEEYKHAKERINKITEIGNITERSGKEIAGTKVGRWVGRRVT